MTISFLAHRAQARNTLPIVLNEGETNPCVSSPLVVHASVPLRSFWARVCCCPGKRAEIHAPLFEVRVCDHAPQSANYSPLCGQLLWTPLRARPDQPEAQGNDREKGGLSTRVAPLAKSCVNRLASLPVVLLHRAIDLPHRCLLPEVWCSLRVAPAGACGYSNCGCSEPNCDSPCKGRALPYVRNPVHCDKGGAPD